MDRLLLLVFFLFGGPLTTHLNYAEGEFARRSRI